MLQNQNDFRAEIPDATELNSLQEKSGNSKSMGITNQGNRMLNFDLSSAINIVLGSVFGGMASWVVSHHYWKRNLSSERILKELKNGFREYFQPIRYPQFYTEEATVIIPEQPPPLDQDVPHIIRAIFTKREIYDGDHIEVLLEFRDYGLNLENPAGISARDHAQRALAPRACWSGYASVSFTANSIPNLSKYRITVVLRDMSGKQYTQSLAFTISKR